MKSKKVEKVDERDNMETKICIWIYRLIENIDGERKIKLISYRLGEKVKLGLLEHINS